LSSSKQEKFAGAYISTNLFVICLFLSFTFEVWACCIPVVHSIPQRVYLLFYSKSNYLMVDQKYIRISMLLMINKFH
jgi:hypothetical protein